MLETLMENFITKEYCQKFNSFLRTCLNLIRNWKNLKQKLYALQHRKSAYHYFIFEIRVYITDFLSEVLNKLL